MIDQADEAASIYIVSLWGRQRREFARRYWFYLTREMAEPPISMCFGADHIARRLKRIWHEYK